MTRTWPSKSMTKLEMLATINSTDSSRSNRNSVEWVVQEQLREVSLLLTSIETSLEVLSQVLWVRDSQELP